MNVKKHIAVLLTVMLSCVNIAFAQRDSAAKAIFIVQSSMPIGNIDKGVAMGATNAAIEKRYGKPKNITTTVIKDRTLEQWIYNNGSIYFSSGLVDSYLLTNAQDTPEYGVPGDVAVKQALELIDNSINHPQSVKDPFAWYVRGYIYKEWYKIFETQNKKSKTRFDAVAFLKKAIELDTTKGKPYPITANFHYQGQIATVPMDFDPKIIRQILKYLGSTFYNDAGSLLDADNYATAIEYYDRFKECMLIAEPNYNLRAREIEFKLALATVYEKMFRSDIKVNSQFFGMTETLHKQVIALDTNNWGANYNLAMLYYNYGVDLINNMSVESDIVVIENITDESTALFKKALPYAIKANALKPDRREVLVCLMGIYFSLYEQEKSDEYKARIALLDKEK